MPALTVEIAALVFGLILEVSAFNLHRRGRPRGEVVPLVIIGGIFLAVAVTRLALSY